ncbi:MAG TPA: DUF1427 family protein [Planctomycetota bacterium]|jgi:XapX domain-containing protein
MKIAMGIVLGLLIGAGCRWFDIPVPSPPRLVGALLVVAMTVGYMVTDNLMPQKRATTAHLCGGPSGQTAENTRAFTKNAQQPNTAKPKTK